MLGRSLEGRVMIVTGAGRGIGREVALMAAREGASVVVNDLGSELAGSGRDERPASDVVAEILSAGGRAVAHHGDVASDDDSAALIELALTRFGQIDAVVNNAGNMVVKVFDKMSTEEFMSVVTTHLFGSFLVAKAASVAFARQGHGAFVHMTSSAALVGNPGSAGYNSAKSGIVALSRTIALDLASRGVRSNCVAPSAVSRMSIGVSELRALDLVAVKPVNDVPAERRQGNAAQVAPLVCYLCSDKAAGITGQIFGVRANEVYLYSQPRPIRALHRLQGWSVDTLAEQIGPAWKTAFTPLETLQDVFSWPPQ